MSETHPIPVPSEVALAKSIAATIIAAVPEGTRCAFRIAESMGCPAVVLPDQSETNAAYFGQVPHFLRALCPDAKEVIAVFAAPDEETSVIQAEVLAGLVLREAERAGRTLSTDPIDMAVGLVLLALEREASR